MEDKRENFFSSIGMFCGMVMISIVWFQIIKLSDRMNYVKIKALIVMATLEGGNILASFWQEWKNIPQVVRGIKVILAMAYPVLGVILYARKKKFLGYFLACLVGLLMVAVLCDYYPKDLPQILVGIFSAVVSSIPIMVNHLTGDSSDALEGWITGIRVISTLSETIRVYAIHDVSYHIATFKIVMLFICSIWSMMAGAIFTCFCVFPCFKKRPTKLSKDLNIIFDMLEDIKTDLKELRVEIEQNEESQIMIDRVASIYVIIRNCRDDIDTDNGSDVENSRRGSEWSREVAAEGSERRSLACSDDVDGNNVVNEDVKRRTVAVNEGAEGGVVEDTTTIMATSKSI